MDLDNSFKSFSILNQARFRWLKFHWLLPFSPLGIAEFFCFPCQQKIVDYTGMTSNSATLSWHDDTRDSNDDVYVRVSTLAQSSFAHTQQKIIMWLLLYGILFLASVYFCTNLITSTNKSLRRGPYAGVYTRPGTINPAVYLQGVPT